MFLHSLHSLLEDRVPPGLTDDQIGPLHDDDADEEGRVAGELHDLPLLVSLTGNTKQKQFTPGGDGQTVTFTCGLSDRCY